MSIDEKLKKLDSKVSKLNNLVNLDEMTKMFEDTKVGINELEKELDKIKTSFNNPEKKELKVINDETYKKYMKQFEDENFDDTEDISQQIEKYNKLMHRMNLCEEYLKSKKQNVIQCDKN